MYTLRRSAHLSLATILFVSSSYHAARAQMDGPFPNYAPDNMNTIMSTHIANLSLQKVIDRQNGDKGSPTTVRKAKVPRGTARRSEANSITVRASGTLASTAYRRTPAVTRKVITQYISWSKTQSPKDAAYLKTVFAKHDPIQIWQNIVREDGLKTGDVSDSLAAYWVLNYLIANKKGDSTRAQALAVRSQVQPLLANNPGFTRLSDAQRQEIAEVWMVNFVVQQGAYGSALKTKNADMMQKLSAAALARFQNEMGLDLRRLNLTNEGFKSRA